MFLGTETEIEHLGDVNQVVEQEYGGEDWQIYIDSSFGKAVSVLDKSTMHDPEEYEDRLPVMVGITPYESHPSTNPQPNVRGKVSIVFLGCHHDG